MITEEYGQFQIECDECGKYVPGFDTFEDALDYAKENGWKIKKVNGEWWNDCQDCE